MTSEFPGGFDTASIYDIVEASPSSYAPQYLDHSMTADALLELSQASGAFESLVNPGFRTYISLRDRVCSHLIFVSDKAGAPSVVALSTLHVPQTKKVIVATDGVRRMAIERRAPGKAAKYRCDQCGDDFTRRFNLTRTPSSCLCRHSRSPTLTFV